jgi:hypothetical protein
MVLILPTQGVSLMYLKPISKFGQSISRSMSRAILSSQHDQDATFGLIFYGNAAAILLCCNSNVKRGNDFIIELTFE